MNRLSSLHQCRYAPVAPSILHSSTHKISNLPTRRPNTIVTRCFDAETIFNISTVSVMPIYTLMVVAPRSHLTKTIVHSRLLFPSAAALYAVLLFAWNPFPSIATNMKLQNGLIMLSSYADLFKLPAVTVITWLHLLLVDLYQARWVYGDALKNSIPAIHSLVLCFMVGPLGVLSHLITRKFYSKLKNNHSENVLPAL